MRPGLRNREKLIQIGNFESPVHTEVMGQRADQVKHYIGTIDIPGIAKGTACLLKNGKVLTCLHNIMDYNALDKGRAELIDFKKHNVSLYFVKDGNIHEYKVTAAPVNGLNKLKSEGSKAWCFDYALLETDRDPTLELGGGFTADKTDHFGSASVTDPARTLAISGPFVSLSKTGEMEFHRFASLSSNQAAQGGFYHITQSGNHPSAPGFSGMGIVPIDRNYSIDTLYAIHSYRDNQATQTGAKISEIRSSIRNDTPSNDNSRLSPHVIHTLNNWYEALRSATINSDRSVSAGAVITFEQAVQIALTGRGNYLSDLKDREASRKEARGPIEEAVRREGGSISGIIDDSTPHNPGHKKELPHLHPPSRSIHAFYDTTYWQKKAIAEQEAKRKADEIRRKQLEATKARDENIRKEEESKAEQIRKQREEKAQKKGNKDRGSQADHFRQKHKDGQNGKSGKKGGRR